MWNSRLPVSRRYPRSAETESPYLAVRYPSRRSTESARSKSDASPGTVWNPTSRDSRAGVRGGSARMARQWWARRGTTHPTSDVNSRR